MDTTTIAYVASHDAHGKEGSRTELDSHTNIPVIGRHVNFLSITGRMTDMKPYKRL